MSTSEFLEYLHRHPATHELAESIGDLLVMRGNRDRVPTSVTTAPHERVAS
ncbi:MAG: hypothetical protein ACT4OX_05580 [Actinomycetota bacterium]